MKKPFIFLLVLAFSAVIRFFDSYETCVPAMSGQKYAPSLSITLSDLADDMAHKGFCN